MRAPRHSQRPLTSAAPCDPSTNHGPLRRTLAQDRRGRGSAWFPWEPRSVFVVGAFRLGAVSLLIGATGFQNIMLRLSPNAGARSTCTAPWVRPKITSASTIPGCCPVFSVREPAGWTTSWTRQQLQPTPPKLGSTAPRVHLRLRSGGASDLKKWSRRSDSN